MPKILLDKISFLQEILRDLKGNVYLAREDQMKKHYEIERQVQLCIEECLSIARHILARKGANIPDAGRDTFIELANLKLISKTTGQSLSSAVGLRNLLVHEYAEFSETLFYDGLDSGYRVFLQFIDEIKDLKL